MVHELADLDEVRMYESRDGPGPNLELPKFDLRNNSKLLCISKLAYTWPDLQQFQKGPPLARTGHKVSRVPDNQ
jgi:hypothetical protein